MGFIACRIKRLMLMEAVVIAVIFLSSNAFALKGVTKVTELEGISEYTLKNGLQVLLFPDPTKETVTVNITYHVGSKHENYGETGMAHLLEHLLFKGSKKHRDIPKELADRGAKPNGTTWVDRTNYFETFNATDDNINWALSLESDRMVNSFVAQEDLDSEMTVVRNELEIGENSPFRSLMSQMLSSAYTWHNYSKSTIGARSDVENVDIQNLKDFYKKYYQPDNATLIIAGRFEEQKMLALVKKYFGKIKKPKRQLPPLYTVEPPQVGERSVTVRRVGDAQLLANLYHVPSGTHEDSAALSVLEILMGDTPSGRLYKNMVEQKIASRVFGFGFPWEDPGIKIFIAMLDKDTDIDQSQAVMLNTIENLTSQPLTEQEVERAKRKILKGFELSFNSSETIATELSEWVAMGDWRLMFLNRDRVEKVKVEDVQGVAEKYFIRNNRTTGKFIPATEAQKVEIPIVKDVAGLFKGYKGREKVAQGEVFDPSWENINKRTKILHLKNGIEVALLPKKTRGEKVVAKIQFQYGDLQGLTNKRFIASATKSMLLKGTQRFSREQLQDQLDKIKTELSVRGGVNWVSANLLTDKENLSEAFSLAAEALTKAKFPGDEFELYKNTAKVDLEYGIQDPRAIAFREYSRHQFPFPAGHPMHVPSAQEELKMIENLKLSDIEQFYREFYSADSMQIAVIGDFDEQIVTRELEKLFGAWRGKHAYKRIAYPHQKLPVITPFFNTPDKENAVVVMSNSIPVGELDEDYAAMVLGNYIFGGGFINSRLAKRLRQNDGLSYSVGSFMEFSPLDSRSSFGAYAFAAPQNVERVIKGFNEELQRVLNDGFTSEEIDAAKSGILQRNKLSRSEDGSLVSALTRNLLYDRDILRGKQLEEKLASLSAEDVHTVMKKYLRIEDFTIITAYDKSKKEQN